MGGVGCQPSVFDGFISACHELGCSQGATRKSRSCFKVAKFCFAKILLAKARNCMTAVHTGRVSQGVSTGYKKISAATLTGVADLQELEGFIDSTHQPISK